MRVHLLCEGNPETRDSWSGISQSVLEELRATGHTVTWTDVDLVGADRWLAALATFSPNRTRWWSRYHLDSVPFRLRSRRAQAGVRGVPKPDVILQVGATFRVPSPPAPVALYCDSNILLAHRARTTGYGEAALLDEAEVRAISEPEAAVYESATRILTLSDLVRRSFVDDFGVPEDRVVTIHGGPNLSRDVPPHVIEAARERRKGQDPTVLFVGRQFRRKGGDLLLRAFARVRQELPDARLLLVGPDRADMPQELPAGTVHLGFLNPDISADRRRLEEAYLESDVFCLPTRFEPFGIVFLEAMLYGLPCVGPDAWAVPEMIRDGETGLLFRPEDETSLADRLLRVLQDPETAYRLGDAGRTSALEYFTWSATVARMTAAFDRIQRAHGPAH